MLKTIVLFLLVFSLIVLSHEFGHFLLAKLNGIRVLEFGIGMGPKLVGFKKGETEYVIRLLPIGGACMFEGEDGMAMGKKEEEEKEGPKVWPEGSFPATNVWARISTVVAGPIFNFILAFILGMILVFFTGSDKPVILGTMEGYPAEEAGMQAGDLILSMNGDSVKLAREIYINTFMNGGNPMTIVFERDGQVKEITLQPKYFEEEDRYLVGFQGYGEGVDCKNLGIFKYAYYELRYSLIATVKSLGMLVTGKASKDDISGPVGIAQVVGEVAEEAAPYGIFVVLLNMFNIALLLSVNLGVINLLPLPALDGGRLVFLIIEALRGKPIPVEKEGMVHFVGLIVLLIFMAFVMFNDISRLIMH